MENIISFPGLGIEGIKLNTVAFNLFGRDIAWYGIIITCGIIAGFMYAMYRAKFEKIREDDVLDLAIWVVIFAVIGARAYYVLTNLDSYKTFYDAIAIWNGGIAIYGAIIAGGLTIAIFSKIRKLNTLKLLDMASPGVMLGQVIGRWGNFVNAEAYGEMTELPWRMGIQNTHHPETIYVHPTFLYESLWNLLGFIIINSFYTRKRFNGQIFLSYITWYGFGRMFIEGLRTDSLYVGSFRISQVVGFACFVIGSLLLIAFSLKSKLNRGTVNLTKADAALYEIDGGKHKAGETYEKSDLDTDSACADDSSADDLSGEGKTEVTEETGKNAETQGGKDQDGKTD